MVMVMVMLCSFQHGHVDMVDMIQAQLETGSPLVPWQDRAMEAYVLCKMSVAWRLFAQQFVPCSSFISFSSAWKEPVQLMFNPKKSKHRGFCRKFSTNHGLRRMY